MQNQSTKYANLIRLYLLARAVTMRTWTLSSQLKKVKKNKLLLYHKMCIWREKLHETPLKQFFTKGFPRTTMSHAAPNVATDDKTSQATFQPTSEDAHTPTSSRRLSTINREATTVNRHPELDYKNTKRALGISTQKYGSEAMLLNMQLQQGAIQQAFGGSSTSFNAKSSAMKANHDLMYDVFGWVLLGAGILAWLGMAKSQAHSSPPR
ncbi:hypothetical protein RND71_023234 [Anisodus tanguticus]|uniref:Uncharacterized protein n=1 Tax=Anisodus tanguticus TaxID=243964 RepID=A0AAE1VDL6_9SOLA|nr:hypothetical protein RND71_023234 [Anisodus tanguticus]